MKFPKMHIAESTVNRILNVAEDINRRSEPPIQPTMPEAAPAVPDPAPQGAALDQVLAQPAQGAPASPEGAQVAVAGAQGESPLDGLLAGLGAPEGA